MKPPDRLVIAGHPFRVIYHTEHLLDGDGEQLAGKMELSANTIRILANDESSEYNRRDSLLHEVLHAVMAVAGVNKSHDTWRSDEAYERVVTALATLLLDTLRRNPPLVHYLMDPGVE